MPQKFLAKDAKPLDGIKPSKMSFIRGRNLTRGKDIDFSLSWVNKLILRNDFFNLVDLTLLTIFFLFLTVIIGFCMDKSYLKDFFENNHQIFHEFMIMARIAGIFFTIVAQETYTSFSN
jgi:hypothetical protein